MLGKYGKAIIAFIALIIATLQANGFDIPAGTGDQIWALVITIAGTFGVFQVANKGASP